MCHTTSSGWSGSQPRLRYLDQLACVTAQLDQLRNFGNVRHEALCLPGGGDSPTPARSLNPAEVPQPPEETGVRAMATAMFCTVRRDRPTLNVAHAFRQIRRDVNSIEDRIKHTSRLLMAEGGGFEPPVAHHQGCFQDSCHQPDSAIPPTAQRSPRA